MRGPGVRPRVPDYEDVRAALRRFVDERDWDAFHAPKDLALSLAVEAGELLEVFQWRDLAAGDLTPEDRRRIGEELADVTMYAMLLADKAGLDLMEAVARKLADNARKYPIEKARGRADKYDRL
jgi:dCTP diphosphatase